MSRQYQQQQSQQAQGVNFGRTKAVQLAPRSTDVTQRINYLMRQAKIAEVVYRDGDNEKYATDHIPTLLKTTNGNIVLRANQPKKGKIAGKASNQSFIITPNGRVVGGKGTIANYDKEYLPPHSIKTEAIHELFSQTKNQTTPHSQSYGDAMLGGGHYYLPNLNQTKRA